MNKKRTVLLKGFYNKRLLLFVLIFMMTSFSLAQQTCREEMDSNTPTNRFVFNNDNTVNDKSTGLTWSRCTLGQTGPDCSGGSAKLFFWDQGLDEVTKNYKGWRVPNIKELSSVIERKCYSPAVNLTVFPNTPARGLYFSSSSYFDIGYLAVHSIWYFDAYSGRVERVNNTRGYIRLVRNTF